MEPPFLNRTGMFQEYVQSVCDHSTQLPPQPRRWQALKASDSKKLKSVMLQNVPYSLEFNELNQLKITFTGQ
jgi:hypothetical protein